MKKFSIKVTIITLFLSLCLLLVVIMTGTQFYFGKNLVKKAIDDNFKTLSSKIETNINNSNQKNHTIVKTLSTIFKNTSSLQEILNNKKKYIETFTSLLSSEKDLYSSYLAFEDNSFFEIINISIDENLKKHYNTKDNDKWLLVLIDGKNSASKKQLITLDKDFNETSNKTINTNYKATNRLWYKNAINSNDTIKTQAYQFKTIDKKGITFAKRVNQNGTVFSIDFLIEDLNKLLKKNQLMDDIDSFIFDEKKHNIAHTIDNKIILKEIKDKILNTDILNQTTQDIFTLNSTKYIFNITKINSSYYDLDEYLLSIIPLEKALEPYKRFINPFIFIIIFLVLISLLLVWYITSLIIKPINLLVRESLKVKNRDFDKIKKIDSDIKEFQILSNSIFSMSSSIQEYQISLEQKVFNRTKELHKKNVELKQLAITDKLTNLYNRIKLDHDLQKMINKAKEYDEIFSIIIIDIDHFKQVNDTHGHQVGDLVLIEFAKILKKSIRATDIVGRWGGEEFIIILPNTNLLDSIKIANKIRTNVQEHKFPVVTNKTASFGVATYKSNETEELLISRADEALYLAKQKGRNKVETIQKN